MKDGTFRALQDDRLPMPNTKEVLQHLLISPHAKDRFRQRASAGELSLQWLSRQEVHLSRKSPSWRQAEDFAHSPDFYLLFRFLSLDGRQDEGCLFIEKGGRGWVAKTFVAQISNTEGSQVPEPPTALLRQLAQAAHTDLAEARNLLQRPPGNKRPSWVPEGGDAWVDGGSWAVSLQRRKLGSLNPYHYSWGNVYSKSKERKKKSRASWQKKQARKRL